MQVWLEADGRGRQFLVRTGTGVVTAVVSVRTDVPEADAAALHRIEIHCDNPHDRPAVFRHSVHPLVFGSDPLVSTARSVLDDVWAVKWTVQWHRYDWVPPDLPLASLDLATDTHAVLTSLQRLDLSALADRAGSTDHQMPSHERTRADC